MKRFVDALLLMSTLLVAGLANAAAVFTIEQVGSDIRVTASGTLITAGLTARDPFPNTNSGQGVLDPNPAFVVVGPPNTSSAYYKIYYKDDSSSNPIEISGPLSFGSSVLLAPSSTTIASGIFGFNKKSGYVYTPVGFVSGSSISGSSVFSDQSFASLGITANTTSIYTLPNNETITVVVGPSVPAPTPVVSNPVIALNLIPPPGGYKVGGSSLSQTLGKAIVFRTPEHSSSAVVSVTVGLSNNTCPSGVNPPVYPNTADIRIVLYSIDSATGKPDAELYSTPMYVGLNVTGPGTLFTFQVPEWHLLESTKYAIGLQSTYPNANCVFNTKWSNVEIDAVDHPVVGQNGFVVDDISWTGNGSSWTSTLATNNAITMKVILISSVPTLSEWSQLLLGLMVMMIGWHFHRERLR